MRKKFAIASSVGILLCAGVVLAFTIAPRAIIIGNAPPGGGNQTGIDADGANASSTHADSYSSSTSSTGASSSISSATNAGDGAAGSTGANTSATVLQASSSSWSIFLASAYSSSTFSPPPIDEAAYDARMIALANLTVIQHKTTIKGTSSTPTSTIITTSTVPRGWPSKAAYPDGGALLPSKRIVAYYGNFYSKQMGVLGEYPESQVLQMLSSTSAMWAAADPTTPVMPAIEYIAVTAQASAGQDGKYRARMPDSQIDKALSMAQKIDGIVILDIQVGLSNVQTEIPLLAKYLALPNVELALDPEFAMHNGERPGTVIGTMDASDINWTANYLAGLVRAGNLPPKVLVVHRFTQAMVTHASSINPLAEVQIVMDMDGFGSMSKKISSYDDFIQAEPVQFTGIKLFYKNDTQAGHLMTPGDVFKLSPKPIYVQYQ